MTSTTAISADYGVHWVRAEMESALVVVRQSLQTIEDGGGSEAEFTVAQARLDELCGIADLLPWLGLRLAFHDMRETLRHLQADADGPSETALAALLSGCVTLPDYLDLMADTGEDHPVLLLALLNELRLAGGRPLLTELELFVHQLGAVSPPPRMQPPSAPLGHAQAWARKLRPHFEMALISVIREAPDARPSLGRIGKIAEQLALVSHDDRLHALWRHVAAVVEALLGLSLESSGELRRQLGASGQALKLLDERGERAAAAALGTLPLNLLYFVARSRGQGPRVRALFEAWPLARILPDPEQLTHETRRLRGPTARLLKQVIDEVGSELNRAKDAIDLAVRTGRGDALPATRAQLEQIAATLSTLGLTPLANAMFRHAAAVDPDPAHFADIPWMDLATGLLRIEHSLDEALFSQMRGQTSLNVDQALNEQGPHASDRREGEQALLREALVIVARVKTALEIWFRDGDAEILASAAQPLQDLAAGLRVMRQPLLADQAASLATLVADPGFAAFRERPERAESFADALTALEVYLDALRAGMPGRPQQLEALAQRIADLTAQARSDDRLAPTAVPGVPDPQAPAREDAADEEGLDPEIRDIFIAEAHEVAAAIEAPVAQWARRPDQREPLEAIRRAFHTLKGSGRMVGADTIGEFGWAIERLLNRCLDGAVTVGPAVIEVVQQAQAAVLPLVVAFADRTPAPKGLADLIAHADALAEGRTPSDPEMVAIFQADAREKIEHLQAWLAESTPKVPESAVRAFHTLRGASAAAGVPAIAAVASPVEAWLGSCRGAGLSLDEDGRTLLSALVVELRRWIDVAGLAEAADLDAAPWVAQIEALSQGAPARQATLGVDPELAHIFSMEALDLIEQMEAISREWRAAPDRAGLAQQMATLAHTLSGAAAMSHAQGIAEIAKALQRRLLAQGEGPSGLLDDLDAIFDGLRDQLDAYRDGQYAEVDSDLRARVEGLGGLPKDKETDPVVSEALALPADWDAPAESDLSTEPMAPLDGDMPVFSSTADDAEPDVDADARQRVDDAAELQVIFLAEARELLEALDTSTQRWERDRGGNAAAGEEARRVLHTLKGSARVAGFVALGEVAQRLEQEVSALVGQTPDRAVFARLQLVTDGLHVAIGDLAAGRQVDFDTLLRDCDLGRAMPIEAAPAPLRIEVEATDDDELAEIFATEAIELLEGLDAALSRLRQQPRELAPRRDMLRALHTLKGGARMAGMVAMGDRAHDFESRLEAVDRPDAVVDDGFVQTVAQEIDALHSLLEQWRGGEPVTTTSDTPEGAPDIDFSIDDPISTGDDRDDAEQDQGPSVFDARLFWHPDEDDGVERAGRQEAARVPVSRLDDMLNEIGEVSIYRSRLEEQVSGMSTQLSEMAQAIARLRDQLRQMDTETDAQISARGLDATTPESDRYASDFDPLEMDRYTRMQELSRALNESVGDLTGLQDSFADLVAESEALLTQQARINTSVQQGLMSTLMVPFSRQVGRLQRVVRSAATERGKQAELIVEGEAAELDRSVLERMTAPLEHLLRNAVIHGIELPQQREAANKPMVGTVRIQLQRDGSQLLLTLSDDGAGLNLDAIEANALRRGLLAAPLPADSPQRASDLAGFIFEPGFSTAQDVAQDAGRGIGTDVVASEVKQLGGALSVRSEAGVGTFFEIRLPLTLAVSQVLMVAVGTESYALPLANIEGIVRIPTGVLEAHLAEDGTPYLYGDQSFRVRYLGDYLGQTASTELLSKTVHAVLIRTTEGSGARSTRVAVVVDQLIGNREIVSKPVGPVISSINGVSSATVLPDGRVVLILDVPALVQARARRARVQQGTPIVTSSLAPLAMVVDDSITIRRVTERLLMRNGYRVITAKDGLDAMAQLQTAAPEVILLDIEMPRADGFEVASFVRNTDRLRHTPIVMITSRSGDKHRERAAAIGVNRYLIKPYQEDTLISELNALKAELHA